MRTERNWWYKQTAGQPLFPDLLWARPENKRQAGKLLIIGGNAHGFAAPAAAYSEAEKAGVGTVRVVLPDSLQKTVGQAFAVGEYAPSTPSGSFSQQALAELLEAAKWSDAVLLAGDLGHNSETAILLEKFTQKYQGQLILVGDTIDYFTSGTTAVVKRTDTVLVTEFTLLQKLASATQFAQAFTSDMDLLRLIDQLHTFTEQHTAGVIVEHLDNTIVAVGGQVSTTKPGKNNLLSTAAQAAVWWLQNSTKPFAAITTAIIDNK